MKLPPVEVLTKYVKFGGGLDLASPVLSIKPGSALQAMNYETGNHGGYKRVDGYERYDGRASPSDAVYYYATMTGSPTVGHAIRGATSGATAVVAYVSGTVVALTMVIGTFANGETITTTGGLLVLLLGLLEARTTIGALTSAPVLSGAPTGLLDATMLNAAADIYRTNITRVPGNGPVRGVHVYKGVTYAFRDNLAGTACQMYRSTAGGWVYVPLGFELSFTSGGTYEIAEGDTIVGNTSGSTAVITRVVLETGSFTAGTAAGRLIFAAQAGAFQAETLNIGTHTDVATIAGAASAIALAAGGRFECENNNFRASTATRRLYGANGVNRGFEYDDDGAFVPIDTGMDEDTPLFLRIHKKKLVFSFRASTQMSGDGEPYQWTAITGAAEIGIGDDVTGYLSQGGDALLINARDSTWQLIGSTVDDFILKPAAPDVGAIPYTAQNAMQAYWMDDRGVVQMARAQEFGNFSYGTVSEHVQPVIDELRPKIIASVVYRGRNQYRVYGDDGSGIIVTIQAAKVVGITQFQYPDNITCACAGEDPTGLDVVFLGDDDGYVYQADKGSSFDGEDIEAYLILPFNNLQTPRLRKRFRKVVQEMSAVGYASLRFQPIFGYGDEDIAGHALLTETVQGAGGYWDVNNWDQFFWDARLVSTPEFSLDGTSINVGLVYYSKSDIDLGHTLQGALIHYTPRALAR